MSGFGLVKCLQLVLQHITYDKRITMMHQINMLHAHCVGHPYGYGELQLQTSGSSSQLAAAHAQHAGCDKHVAHDQHLLCGSLFYCKLRSLPLGHKCHGSAPWYVRLINKRPRTMHMMQERVLFAGRSLVLSPPTAIPLGPSQDDWGTTPYIISAGGAPLQHRSIQSSKGLDSPLLESSGHQDQQQQHGPATLQQAIADEIQTAAYNAGSSDNLAVVVIDVSQHRLPAGAGASSHVCSQPTCMSEAVCDTSSPLGTGLHKADAADPDIASSDEIFLLKHSGRTTKGNRLLEHALPAELASGFKSDAADAPGWSGIALWHDISQISLGSIISRPDKPTACYRLLHQLAELPRYADHLHTSWLGPPVLSTMSSWARPHLPRFATSQGLTPPHPHADEARLVPCTDALWALEEDLKAPLHGGTSQLMLSPGTMLQLVPKTDAIPASCCSWHGWDSQLEAANGGSGPLCDDSNTQDCTAWCTPDAVALAWVVAGMYSEGLDHSQILLDDASDRQPADDVFTSDSTPAFSSDSHPVKRVPSRAPEWHHDTVHEWQKYCKGRSFARGSFGEVWHAERTSGGPHGECPSALQTPDDC